MNRVYSVGLNDADYKVQPIINGKRVLCPFYQKWIGMIRRCYSRKWLEKNPTYEGCTVCDEWLTFSNFKKWMEVQDWQGKHLDKDIIIKGNKVYQPEACAFVTIETNSLINESTKARGNYLIGVSFEVKKNKFRASCSLSHGRQVNLGHFNTEIEAHDTYRKYKSLMLLRGAFLQDDDRVRQALIKRANDMIDGMSA